MLVKPLKRWIKKRQPYFESRSLSVDFLNGATVPTFMLLIGSVVSSKILDETIKSAKLSLGLAGFLGLVFILREILTG